MNLRSISRSLILAVSVSLLVMSPTINAQANESVETQTKVHRLTTAETSPYDAFAYLNRLNTGLSDDESPKDFAGRLFGRLANQEGRILLKLPTGFSPSAYDGLKIFYRTYGASKAGNCVACHVPPTFTDNSTRIVDGTKQALVTPSLRNLGKSAPYLHDGSAQSLEDLLKQKIRMAEQARNDANAGLDPEYANINITQDDIPALVEFLGTMNDAGQDHFREIVMDATILDTSDWE